MEQMIQEKLKCTVVLGNGFDLDLGFNTRFSDFVESDEWKKMYEKRSKDTKHYSLLQYLNGKRYIDKWFDIESALVDYVSRRKDGSFVNNAKEDWLDYKLLCEALGQYLNNHIESNPHDLEKSCAGKFLKSVSEIWFTELCVLYSFNFTPIDFYLNVLNTISHDIKEKYVHGRIKDKSLILGIEISDINEIAPGYSFLIKSNNPSYQSSELSSDLLKSGEVIFYGHSLNSIDIGYFEEYFKMMETNRDINRRITIITYDDNSMQQMFDNLRRNGISVQKLFTHSAIEVIKTKNIKMNKTNKDLKRFENLLERINNIR